jgi:hypothetical protein
VHVEAAPHAVLADSYRLKDLNSTNGTQVNVLLTRGMTLSSSAAREGNTAFQVCSTETAKRSSENKPWTAADETHPPVAEL